MEEKTVLYHPSLAVFFSQRNVNTIIYLLLQLSKNSGQIGCAHKLPLQSLERLNGVGIRGVRGRKGIAADKRADSLEQELYVLNRVVALNFLVQVAVEGHSLHVIALAQLHKCFSRSVGCVEHLKNEGFI